MGYKLYQVVVHAHFCPLLLEATRGSVAMAFDLSAEAVVKAPRNKAVRCDGPELQRQKYTEIHTGAQQMHRYIESHTEKPAIHKIKKRDISN